MALMQVRLSHGAAPRALWMLPCSGTDMQVLRGCDRGQCEAPGPALGVHTLSLEHLARRVFREHLRRRQKKSVERRRLMTMERHSKPRSSQLAWQTTPAPAKPGDNTQVRQKAKSSFNSCKTPRNLHRAGTNLPAPDLSQALRSSLQTHW